MLNDNEIEKELNAFEKWFKNSVKRDQIIYYTGFLASDLIDEHEIVQIRAAKIKDYFNYLYESNYVTLTQRKLNDDVYQYIAIRI
jgi:hypothetical protein|tara:strand:+ start:205 stop:459 length:255 start_codon:yes stop_codon:yes gene_type:complete